MKTKILDAVQKGYTVDDFGNVWFDNKMRRLNLDGMYYRFSIRDLKGKPISIPVHKLQAYQKFGEAIFEPGIVVRHLDGNSMNNSYDNIQIGTQSDNMYDIPVEERITHAKKASLKHIKFNAEEVKKFYNENRSYKKTMDFFKIPSKSTLHNILNNR